MLKNFFNKFFSSDLLFSVNFFNRISIFMSLDSDFTSIDEIISCESIFADERLSNSLDTFSINQSFLLKSKEFKFLMISKNKDLNSKKFVLKQFSQYGFFSFAACPDVGDVVYVSYFDYNLVERFFIGLCVFVSRNSIFTYFSIYQKSYGFFMTFFTHSPCFIGFYIMLHPSKPRIVVKNSEKSFDLT
jgi:hypothetical protein